MNTPTPQKRYPGVKPFETSERDLFFGRDRDIEDLLDLIWLEKLVVLFGKSGYGKSSLINAGILPKIEEEAVPIVVRLGSYVDGQTPTPLDNLRSKIDERVADNPDADFIATLDVPKTLWHQVKSKQSPTQRRFVFIFDQFEEFFTYPLAEQQAFKEQIADLLYTEVPQAVRNLNDTLSGPQQTFIATPFEAKVLFAIRADRMSLLDAMKDKLPAILQKRYELKGLSVEQARQAIERPAASTAGSFASPVFFYSPEALRLMTQKLAETKVSQRSGIEAFQLQILCEYLEDKIIKGEIPDNCIEAPHFAGQINEVFEGYYQRLIEKLDPSSQQAAQRLIEEKLIFEDEKTGEARRLSVDSGVLLHEADITQLLLNQLESNFLLRRESTSTGGFNYEVSHDTLITPVLKLKAERKAKEKAEEIRLVARRKQRRLLAVLAVVVVALAMVIGVVVYVLKLRNDAVASLEVAEKSNRASTNTALALRWNRDDSEIAAAIAGYNFSNHIGNASVQAIFNQVLLDTNTSIISKKIAWHNHSINSVAFSPDGKYIATGSGDKTAKMWLVETGKCIQTFSGHSSYINAIAFSPDGKYLVSGSDDATAKLWSIETGQVIRTFEGHLRSILSVAFSSDGKYLTTGSVDGTAKLWSTQTGEVVKTFSRHHQPIYSVSYSPNEKYLATASTDSTVILWSIDSGAPLKSFKHQMEALCVAFSPNGDYLATGGMDKKATLWSIKSGQVLKTFIGHQKGIMSLSFSPDGQYLATGSLDYMAKLWAVSSGLNLKTFIGHKGNILSVAFSPDGQYLATGSDDNTAKLWSLDTSGQPYKIFKGQSIVWLAFSPDGKSLATSDSNLVKLWSLETGQLIKTLQGHRLNIWSLAFSPDGKYMITGSRDKTVKLWSLETEQSIKTFTGYENGISSVAFSPDGKYIATGYCDLEEKNYTLKIWSLETGQPLNYFNGDKRCVTSISFSPDGKYIATGSDDYTAKLWSLETGSLLKTFRGHREIVQSVAFSPDGKFLATASRDFTVKLWSVESGQNTKTFKQAGNIMSSVAFSPNGKYLGIGTGRYLGTDYTAILWSLETQQPIKIYRGHQANVRTVGFSPDSKFLATGSLDHTAKLWSVPTTFNPHAIQTYSLLELYYLGVQLESADLKAIGMKENLKQ